MAKSILLIENEAKLKLNLDNIVIIIDGEEGSHPISDLECVIFDSMYVSATGRLLAKLTEFNVPLIVCDNKHLPCGYYYPITNHSRSSKVLQKQIDFREKNDLLWKEILKNKIRNQARVIKILFDNIDAYDEIMKFADDFAGDDISNLEGPAAKSYFYYMQGSNFKRENKELVFNAAINYGYAIIRSQIAKYLIGYGLNLQLGIHHKNEYNGNNLVDDLIEPLRPFVDLFCFKLMKDASLFTPRYKRQITKIIINKVKYNKKNMELNSVINEYVMQIASIIVENKNIEGNIIFPDVCSMDCADEDYDFEILDDDYDDLLFGEGEEDEV